MPDPFLDRGNGSNLARRVALPNGRLRRVSPVLVRPGERPLTEPRAGARPRRREAVADFIEDQAGSRS